MRKLLFGFLLLASFASPCRAAGLQLSIQDGKISIDAQDVTIRQILAEWSRVGKTRIVNIERLGGSAITIRLDAVPERQALDTILRNVPGYIAAPRATFVASASIYDTILIMATTTAVAAIRSPGSAFGGMPSPGGTVTQFRQGVPLTPGVVPDPPEPAPDQDDPAIAAAAAAGLVPVAAPTPGTATVQAPLVMPGGVPQSAPAAPTATPSNQWIPPIGTPQPGLAPPPAPAPVQQPVQRLRPPQADR
ncbi:MAG TPA: hypothetical protein VJM31_00165 [Vicinamibacterales bacterium]|nr:hypothetical protein [Vicinamibacterales bacterium]